MKHERSTTATNTKKIVLCKQNTKTTKITSTEYCVTYPSGNKKNTSFFLNDTLTLIDAGLNSRTKVGLNAKLG